jgi:hypothetical protein
MALSFTEKQYWKNRVEKTVNGKITELRSLSAKVIEETKIKADCQLTDELKISEDLAAYENRSKEIEELEAEQKELLAMIAADVFGDETPFRVSFADIKREIDRLVKERTESLFSQHPLGQHLETLEVEKARLLDAILLATNVQQVGEIMDDAAALEPLPAVGDSLEPEQPALLLSDYSIQ